MVITHTIGDHTYTVERTWGQTKWMQKRCREARAGGDDDKAAERIIAATDETLLKAVIAAEGIVDRDGEPLEWGPEALDSLDPDEVNGLLEFVLGKVEEGNAGTSSELASA